MNLDKDTQLTLVGLVLLADDEGRELAHPKLLSREFDYAPEQIERALQALADNDLIVLYHVGKHRYYSLTRWKQWQSLSSQKITPSKYPAPPLTEVPAHVAGDAAKEQGTPLFPAPQVPMFPEIPLESLGNQREHPAQSNRRESKETQEKRSEEEQEAPPPLTLVQLPAARDSDAMSPCSAQLLEVTHQVATILRLPVTDGLARLVSDYLDEPGVALLGAADAAREWIEDPRRNTRGQPMTLAFFRRWLQRERESYQRRQAALSPPPLVAIATGGANPPGQEDPYRTFVTQRAQALLACSEEGQAHEAGA